jgi:hypothetical protein
MTTMRACIKELGQKKSVGLWADWTDRIAAGEWDEYVEPKEAVDLAKDKRVVIGYYGVAVSPEDGSIWGSSLGFPGYVARFNPGPNPSETGLTEIY